MQQIISRLRETLERGQIAVTAVIIHADGSTPRASGARLMLAQDGTQTGSIGGGESERKCLDKAHQLLTGNEWSAQLSLSTGASPASNTDMICGGQIEILLCRFGPESYKFFRRLESDYRDSRRSMLVTLVPEKGEPASLTVIGSTDPGTLPAALHAELIARTSRSAFLIERGQRKYFVEPLLRPTTVFIAGAGHVALATARLAASTGFATIIIDDRPELANRERFPQALDIRVVDRFGQVIDKLYRDDFLVITTRNHQFDHQVLAQALRTEAGYIGMIGSRRKREAIYTALRSAGFSAADLERVHCPIGLDIGAETPEEIGVSIIAQLIRTRADAGRCESERLSRPPAGPEAASKPPCPGD